MNGWVNYGPQIRKYREAYGITQEELATKAGISLSSLRRYEINERKPTLDTLESIAHVFGVKLAIFLWHDPIDKRSYLWADDLEDKLKQLGYSIGYDEDEGALWINYPDGSALGVTEEDLKILADNSDTYLRFLLEDLRKRLVKYLTPPSPAKPEGDE